MGKTLVKRYNSQPDFLSNSQKCLSLNLNFSVSQLFSYCKFAKFTECTFIVI